MKVTGVILSSALIHCALCYNILGVFPHIGESHFYVFVKLMKELARKGHNVTVVGHFPLKEPIPGYRDIVLDSLMDKIGDFTGILNLEKRDPNQRITKYATALMLADLGKLTCEEGLKSKSLQDLLKEKGHFDLIIAESFNSDCFLGLVRTLNCPVIGVSSCIFLPWTSERVGNPENPSYIPNHFLMFSDKMSFIERVENTIVTALHQIYFTKIVRRQEEEIVRRHLGREAGTLETYIYNLSLLLVNTHFSLNLPRPLVPNIVEIGGIHIEKPKPLPKNIEKWINDSKDGVIYFSLGSMVQGHTLKKEKLEAFLKAFSRLPQRVLWKWENESMEGKPDTVMIQKWMPQFDILSHPNVKAFIAHGGMLGITEAVHCGVPLIVMPQFGDQHNNAKAIEANGGGVILQMSEVTEETVYKSLTRVLSSSFQKQAKELSERFRDRPLPPLETAIYWVEYVIRHRGAPHMKTAAVNMPWYQYFLVDVISFIVAVLALFFYISFLTLRFIWRMVTRKPGKPKTS